MSCICSAPPPSRFFVHSFLLSPAQTIRTLMCPARSFALESSLGLFRMGMMDKLRPSGWGWVVFGAFLVAGPTAVAQAPSAKLADYFGFLPLEIYKLDNRIGNLQLKDLDGDKVDDIIVSNNGRSRIDLLLSTKKTDDDKDLAPVPQGPQRPRVRPPDAAGEHSGQQGSRQRRHRRLQRRRQARPGLLRHAGRGRDPFQRRQGAVRQSQEDQHRRRRAETGGLDRGRLRPGRPRRLRPAGRERADFRLPDRPGQC